MKLLRHKILCSVGPSGNYNGVASSCAKLKRICLAPRADSYFPVGYEGECVGGHTWLDPEG